MSKPVSQPSSPGTRRSQPLRVTLSGSLGSGKSTIGRGLAEKFGIRFISAGSIFREIGRSTNMDALQTNLAAENDTRIDEMVDSYVRQLAASDESFVIDSRMAWFFVPNAINIYLYTTPDTAAARILGDVGRTGEAYADQEAAKEGILERRLSEVRRYRNLYGVDIDRRENFHLFIGTDDAAPADVLAVAVDYIGAGIVRPSSWASRLRVVPLVNADAVSASPPGSQAAADPTAPLPMHFEDGFLFYRDAARLLLDALRGPSSLVHFIEHALPDLDAATDWMAFTRAHYPASHFLAWSNALGCRLKVLDRYEATA